MPINYQRLRNGAARATESRRSSSVYIRIYHLKNDDSIRHCVYMVIWLGYRILVDSMTAIPCVKLFLAKSNKNRN